MPNHVFLSNVLCSSDALHPRSSSSTMDPPRNKLCWILFSGIAFLSFPRSQRVDRARIRTAIKFYYFIDTLYNVVLIPFCNVFIIFGQMVLFCRFASFSVVLIKGHFRSDDDWGAPFVQALCEACDHGYQPPSDCRRRQIEPCRPG